MNQKPEMYVNINDQFLEEDSDGHLVEVTSETSASLGDKSKCFAKRTPEEDLVEGTYDPYATPFI